MDTLLPSSIQWRAGSAANQEAFDKAFGLPSLDGCEKIIGKIYVLKKGAGGGGFLHPSDFVLLIVCNSQSQTGDMILYRFYSTRYYLYIDCMV
jgi:hypothetical protein